MKSWLSFLLCLLVTASAIGSIGASGRLGAGASVNSTLGATVWFGATLPTAPTTFSTTSSPPVAGSTCRGSYYTPGVGGDAALTLQTAIDDAAAGGCTNGDVIELTAGTTYTSTTNFNLDARTGTAGWVYIISSHAPEISGSGLPAAGTRVNCTGVADMASLRSSGSATNGNILKSSNGASFYRLVGLDIEATDTNASGGNIQNVVNFDHADTTTATLTKHVTFDRDCIEGAPSYGAIHGITIEGEYMEVTESDFENIFSIGNGDNQCLFAADSDGPFKFFDNWIHAGGQGSIFGGSDSTIPNIIPSDIDIENNDYFHTVFSGTATVSTVSTAVTINSTVSGSLHISMSLFDASNNTKLGVLTSGSGTSWTFTSNSAETLSAASVYGVENGKNIVEFKAAQRVLFKHNFVQNAGGAGQQFSMLATVRNQNGGNPLNVVNDMDVENNVFSNSRFSAWNILLQDNTDGGNFNTAPSYRHLYRNNLWLLFGNNGQVQIQLSANGVPDTVPGLGGDIIFDHDSMICVNGCSDSLELSPNAAGQDITNFVVSNTIFDTTGNEIHCTGNNSYANCVPPNTTNPAWVSNVVVAGTQTYPAGTSKPANDAAVGWTSYGSTTAAAGYALTSGSTYHAAGVSGLGLPYSSAGTADSTDIGVNVSLLPSAGSP